MRSSHSSPQHAHEPKTVRGNNAAAISPRHYAAHQHERGGPDMGQFSHLHAPQMAGPSFALGKPSVYVRSVAPQGALPHYSTKGYSEAQPTGAFPDSVPYVLVPHPASFGGGPYGAPNDIGAHYGGAVQYVYNGQQMFAVPGVPGVPTMMTPYGPPLPYNMNSGLRANNAVVVAGPPPKEAKEAHAAKAPEADNGDTRDDASVDSFSPIPLAKLPIRAAAPSTDVPKDHASATGTKQEDLETGIPECNRTISPDQQAKWDEMYQRLLKFKEEHGHTRVPETHPDAKLVHWVGNQRKAMSRELRGLQSSTFDKRRVALLNSIKFEWAKARAVKPGLYERYSWDEMFRTLCQFKEAHGHTRVPLATDQRLANWVRNQRTAMSRKLRGLPFRCLNDKRINSLDSIGFAWVASKDGIGANQDESSA